MPARFDPGDVTPLIQPHRADAQGVLRPPLTQAALRMSAEIAADTYAMRVEKWMQGGWRDVTIHVDGVLTPLAAEERYLTASWKKYRVRSRIRQRSAIGQMLGAMRQRDGSSTGKALVMLHDAPGGRFVVAVSFMGTGRRFYDWFSNFRMSTRDGVHKGFAELCDQFAACADRIQFPRTAQQLGREKLTLSDVLAEMARPDSRFTLWLSGHSQGAAVMQLYARQLLLQGVRAAHVAGYGFASPTVAACGLAEDPAAFPLWHVLNSDDLVPRCGAQLHLGVCLTYPADEALRRRCYLWPRDEESVRARLLARPIVRAITDTPSAILQFSALLTLISALPGEEAAELLGLDPGMGAVLEGAEVHRQLQEIRKRLQGVHRLYTGQNISPELLAQAMQPMKDAAAACGLSALLRALLQLMKYPHRMSVRKGDVAMTPYRFIAQQDVQRLICWYWLPGSPPRRQRIDLPDESE